MKLVVVDIDGCLLPRGGQQIDLSVVDRIREHNRLSRKNSAVTPVTLCSGRPEPYVELLMRLIEGYIPALFEWGGGLYIPNKYDFLYNDVFTEEVRESRQVIEGVIRRELVSKLGARIQPGKEVAITIYPGQDMSSELLHAKLEKILEDIEAARYYTIYCTQTHILPVRSFFSDKSRLNKLSGVNLHKARK